MVTESVGLGRMFEFVCLFVCSEDNSKTKDLRNAMVLGLKGQGHRVSKCIFTLISGAKL